MTGEELRDKRKSMDWTQSQLAQRIGVSKGTVINYEKGKKIPESKNKILQEVFRKETDLIYPLANKISMLSPELLKRAKQSNDPSSFIIEEVLNKFHPVEVVDYIDRHRDEYFNLEEFRLLSKNVVGTNEIQNLKREIKKINERLDDMRNS